MDKQRLECPECGCGMVVKKEWKPSPDKPPEVGDWFVPLAFPNDSPRRVTQVRKNTNDFYPSDRWEVRLENSLGWHLWRESGIVRRKDDPLQKGDRGLLDGNIRCYWVGHDHSNGTIEIVFDKKDVNCYPPKLREWGWVDESRFTLTEPYWKSNEEM